MREIVSTEAAPRAIGPYSQAVKAGGMIFVSGQIALDPSTGEVRNGDIRVQTQQVLDNLKAILMAAGSDLSRVVKTTVFLRHLSDFAGMNEIYSQYWKQEPPARSTVEVSQLPRNVLVEIEAIALG